MGFEAILYTIVIVRLEKYVFQKHNKLEYKNMFSRNRINCNLLAEFNLIVMNSFISNIFNIPRNAPPIFITNNNT